MAPPQRFLEIEEYAEGFTIVWMNRNPVNTMDTEMWMQLSKALRDVESNPKQRGIAFLSGVTKNVFTAGNDILELYAPRTTRDKYKRFWKISNTFLGNLYVSRLVTIAGIRGACPAGGCCLSLCCDYRIMTDNGYIGLNEVALGISVPKYWGKLMERTVGSGKAEKLLQFARLLKTKDAHECGLVDTVCSADQLKTRVVETLKQLTSSKLPEMGRAETKLLLRGDFVREWMDYLDEEANTAWKLLASPETVATLGGVLDRLSKTTRTAQGTSRL